MTENNITYQLSKLLSLNCTTTTYWNITMLDEKLFPNVMWTHNQDYGIKIYDITKCAELIFEFPPTKNNQSIHMNSSCLYDGINYKNGILTYLEPYERKIPTNGEPIHKKVTRYVLLNDDSDTIKIKKICSYVISDLGTSLWIYNNRLFSCCDLVNIKIYNASDGRLIEYLPDYTKLCEIEKNNFIALKSKTHLMIYSTINDKKIMIDRQINGIMYYSKESQNGQEESPPTITRLNDTHVVIEMHCDMNKNKIKLLYKLIEDSGIDEKDQCSICFGFAEKNKALVPCGHIQFCGKCIETLKKCPLCDKNITSILNIYK